MAAVALAVRGTFVGAKVTLLGTGRDLANKHGGGAEDDGGKLHNE